MTCIRVRPSGPNDFNPRIIADKIDQLALEDARSDDGVEVERFPLRDLPLCIQRVLKTYAEGDEIILKEVETSAFYWSRLKTSAPDELYYAHLPQQICRAFEDYFDQKGSGLILAADLRHAGIAWFLIRSKRTVAAILIVIAVLLHFLFGIASAKAAAHTGLNSNNALVSGGSDDAIVATGLAMQTASFTEYMAPTFTPFFPTIVQLKFPFGHEAFSVHHASCVRWGGHTWVSLGDATGSITLHLAGAHHAQATIRGRTMGAAGMILAPHENIQVSAMFCHSSREPPCVEHCIGKMDPPPPSACAHSCQCMAKLEACAAFECAEPLMRQLMHMRAAVCKTVSRAVLGTILAPLANARHPAGRVAVVIQLRDRDGGPVDGTVDSVVKVWCERENIHEVIAVRGHGGYWNATCTFHNAGTATVRAMVASTMFDEWREFTVVPRRPYNYTLVDPVVPVSAGSFVTIQVRVRDEFGNTHDIDGMDGVEHILRVGDSWMGNLQPPAEETASMSVVRNEALIRIFRPGSYPMRVNDQFIGSLIVTSDVISAQTSTITPLEALIRPKVCVQFACETTMTVAHIDVELFDRYHNTATGMISVLAEPSGPSMTLPMRVAHTHHISVTAPPTIAEGVYTLHVTAEVVSERYGVVDCSSEQRAPLTMKTPYEEAFVRCCSSGKCIGPCGDMMDHPAAVDYCESLGWSLCSDRADCCNRCQDQPFWTSAADTKVTTSLPLSRVRLQVYDAFKVDLAQTGGFRFPLANSVLAHRDRVLVELVPKNEHGTRVSGAEGDKFRAFMRCSDADGWASETEPEELEFDAMSFFRGSIALPSALGSAGTLPFTCTLHSSFNSHEFPYSVPVTVMAPPRPSRFRSAVIVPGDVRVGALLSIEIRLGAHNGMPATATDTSDAVQLTGPSCLFYGQRQVALAPVSFEYGLYSVSRIVRCRPGIYTFRAWLYGQEIISPGTSSAPTKLTIHVVPGEIDPNVAWPAQHMTLIAGREYRFRRSFADTSGAVYSWRVDSVRPFTIESRARELHCPHITFVRLSDTVLELVLLVRAPGPVRIDCTFDVETVHPWHVSVVPGSVARAMLTAKDDGRSVVLRARDAEGNALSANDTVAKLSITSTEIGATWERELDDTWRFVMPTYLGLGRYVVRALFKVDSSWRDMANIEITALR